jgi:chromosome segregation ATPase
MNDSQTHFIAVCPQCSTALKIRRVFAGQQVKCKHCEQKFVAEDTDAPGTTGSVEAGATPSSATSSQKERIVVTCPNCHSALSVRRVYIGRQVRCKQCDDTFLVSDPTVGDMPSADSRPERVETDGGHAAVQVEISRRNQELKAAHDQLQAQIDRHSSENQELKAANDQLQVEVDRLASEYHRIRDEHETLQASHKGSSSDNQQLRSALDRIRTEHDRLLHELDRATTELNAFRADLGGIAPAEVGPLVQERDVLTAEADRLRGEIRILREEQTARDRTIGERERQWDTDLNTARAEVERLEALLQRREADLESARAEQDRLGMERQRACDETERLRAALAERDQVTEGEGDRLRGEADRLRIEGDQLRGEIEGLRGDLADAEQGRRDGIARIEAQLAGLAEQHRRLQEQHEAAERSSQEHQERNQELRAELDRLRSSSPTLASNDEIQAARAEIESLKQQLLASERIQREMADLLAGIGIRFREV